MKIFFFFCKRYNSEGNKGNCSQHPSTAQLATKSGKFPCKCLLHLFPSFFIAQVFSEASWKRLSCTESSHMGSWDMWGLIGRECRKQQCMWVKGHKCTTVGSTVTPALPSADILAGFVLGEHWGETLSWAEATVEDSLPAYEVWTQNMNKFVF